MPGIISNFNILNKILMVIDISGDGKTFVGFVITDHNGIATAESAIPIGLGLGLVLGVIILKSTSNIN